MSTPPPDTPPPDGDDAPTPPTPPPAAESETPTPPPAEAPAAPPPPAATDETPAPTPAEAPPAPPPPAATDETPAPTPAEAPPAPPPPAATDETPAPTPAAPDQGSAAPPPPAATDDTPAPTPAAPDEGAAAPPPLITQVEPQPGYVGAPPPPPSWGAPGSGGPPPPESRRSRLPLVGILGAVLVLAIGGVVFALTRGGGDDARPEDAVRDYFAAARRGDCRQMFKLITEETWQTDAETPEEAIAQCQDGIENGGLGLDELEIGQVKVVSQDGDRATVSVKLTLLGDSSTERVNLRKEGGTWRIHMPE